MPDHCVPEAVVKQLQLKSRGEGVGSAVGTAPGVRSGVATTPGTLTSSDGAPGRIGVEGRVSGGGPGGGAGTCARATPANPASASARAIVNRTHGLKLGMDAAKILIAKTFSSDDATIFSQREREMTRYSAPPL